MTPAQDTYGAAYGGEPQKVSSLPSGSNWLLKPKSAILISKLWSNKRFSAYKVEGKISQERDSQERDSQEKKGPSSHGG